MKKILIIGDLRTAYNYGAIATTESLMKLLDNEHLDAEFKYIDHRSMVRPTPETGWPKQLPNNENTVIKQTKDAIKHCLPGPVVESIRKIKGRGTDVPDFVPYKLSQFEDYYGKMVSGQTLRYDKQMLDWADIVYINSEGNIVHGTDKFGKYRMGARYVLFMAWVSKIKMHKPTLIVNHTVDPDNYNAFEIISDLYPKLDKVYVRETLSLPLLEQHGVFNAEFVPDALFSYEPVKDWKPNNYLKSQINFNEPYICIGDSSGIRNNYNQVKWNVVEVLGEIVSRLKDICPQVVFVDGYSGGNEDINRVIRDNGLGYVSLRNTDYHNLYQVLKRADLFVSGRWHASILSTLAQTPILLWGSDSHKTKSLYTLLDYKYRFFEVSTLPVNIPEMIEEAKKILADSEHIKSKMASVCAEFRIRTQENAKVLKQYVNK